MADPLTWLEDEARRRRAGRRERVLVTHGRSRPGWIERGPVELLNLASNDYLGLASDARVIAAACAAASRYGWGSGASPLVCGHRQPHADLAEALAAFERSEAVALFPSGYAANLGVLAALAGPGDLILGDRLNHSCLVAGARLARAALRVYPHGDTARLAALLARYRGRYRRVLIVTDGVFSMDGDLAPLPMLVALAGEHEAILIVDEAHGTGVFGPDGRGAASALAVADQIPVRVGTLSKALGSLGGFVAGSRALIDHVRHAAPTHVYSTALPPAAAAAAMVALQIAMAEPQRRERLFELGDRLRAGLAARGLACPSPAGPIVPVILGSTVAAQQAAAGLQEAGFLVPAIRPPTVPEGTSRLRISLCAVHEVQQVDALLEALDSSGAGPLRAQGRS